jgi:hypothetical protein
MKPKDRGETSRKRSDRGHPAPAPAASPLTHPPSAVRFTLHSMPFEQLMENSR